MAERTWGAPAPQARELAEEMVRACLHRDKDATERLRQGLVEIGEPAISVLGELAHHPADLVRLAVVDTLLDIGHPAAIPIFEALLEDVHGDVRIEAAEGLTRLQPKKASRSVARLLRSEDEYDRANALWNLGQVKDSSLLPTIEELAAADRDEVVRRVARVVSVQIRSGVEGLLQLLHDEDVNVRYCAVEALMVEKDPSSAEPLFCLLFEDPDPFVRSHAGMALRDVIDATAIERLQLALNDPEPRVRMAVSGSIGMVLGEGAFPLLRQLAKDDPHEWVRDGARRLMRYIQKRQGQRK